ncbi:hypothetical protein DICA2_C04654 [Diutina catenulata]
MRLLAIFAVVAGVQADLSEYLDYSIRCRYIPENDRVVTFEAAYKDPILYFQSQKLLENVPFEAAKVLDQNSANGFVGVLKAVDGTDYHLVEAKIFMTFEFPSAGLWCGVSPGLVPGMFQGGRQKTAWLILLYKMFVNLHHDLESLEGKMDQMKRLSEGVGMPLWNCMKRLEKSIESTSVDFSEQDMEKCLAIYESHQETWKVNKNEGSHQKGRKPEKEINSGWRNPPSDKPNYKKSKLGQWAAEQEKELKKKFHNTRGTDTINSLIMLVLWGLYYRRNSIVMQDMLSTTIIPYTATFIISILGPYGRYINAIIALEIAIRQVEWIRRFSSGYGITHNVRQNNKLESTITMFRWLIGLSGAIFSVYYYVGGFKMAKIFHSAEVSLVPLKFAMFVVLVSVIIFVIYSIVWWVYLWKGYVNRSKIDSSYRTRYILTLVMMTIRELPFVRLDRVMTANLPPATREVLDVFIGFVVPFLVFYGFWANYDMAKREPQQHEKDAHSQNSNELSATHEKDEVIGAKDEKVSAMPDKVAENVTGALDGGSDEEAAKNVTALDEEPVLVDLVE